MNLRDFKKDVEYIVGELVDDCSLFITLNPHKSSEKIAEIISEAVDLYNDMKDKANAKVEPKQRKACSQISIKRCSKEQMLSTRNSAL